MDGMNQILDRFGKIWGQATFAGRASIVGGTAVILISVVGVAIWSSTPDYKLLRDGITPVMAGEIVSALDSNGIPNKLNYSGNGVMVPTSRWNEANVAIASISGSQDTPGAKGSSGGLFGGGTHGHFDSVRMKEASLKKSIESMQAVKSAEVHLAIPEPSPFRSKRQPPSASVVVEPHAGLAISHETATSIVHTVSKAVEGLDPKRVSLADTDGRLIGNMVSDDPSTVRRRYIENIESTLALKAEDLLTANLGRNRAVVRVTVEVDEFIDKTTTKQQIDPSAKVTLLERITSSDQKGLASSNGGVAGSNANNPTNLQTTTGANQPISGKSEMNESTYDYARETQETRTIGGQIVRMSISATVDATIESEAPTANQDPPQLILQQADVENLIKSATGFDVNRGDQITVFMGKFANLPGDEEEDSLAEEEKWAFVSTLARNASLGITALAALILGSTVLRKIQPITVAPPNDREQRALVEALSKRVESNPDAVSKILAAWIEQQPNADSDDSVSKAA